MAPSPLLGDSLGPLPPQPAVGVVRAVKQQSMARFVNFLFGRVMSHYPLAGDAGSPLFYMFDWYA